MLQTARPSTRDSVGYLALSQRNLQRVDACASPLAIASDAPRGSTRNRRHTPALDDVSKGIIEQLQQDGRMPYAAIGKAVGLSEAAVRQRVQRLLDSGVMQIVAVTDPLQLGFARQAMIGIHAEGDLEPIADALATMAEVDYVIVTAGSFDLMVEVVCESDDHLLELLSKRIRAIDGVHAHRVVRLPQAAQADLLVGSSVSRAVRRPVALARDLRATTSSRVRRCPATSTSTSRSSAPASPACGRPTTWPRATRRCGSPCSRRRSPGSARPAATAAGARRCSPPRRDVAGAAGVVARRALAAASPRCATTVDEVARVTAAEGIDCDFHKGGTIAFARTAAPARPRPRRGRGRARRGATPTTTCGCSPRTRPRELAGATRRARRDVHAALRARSTRPGWSADWPRAVERRGVHDLRADPRALDRARAGAGTAHGTVRADAVVRATEGFTPASPGSGGRSRRSTR